MVAAARGATRLSRRGAQDACMSSHAVGTRSNHGVPPRLTPLFNVDGCFRMTPGNSNKGHGVWSASPNIENGVYERGEGWLWFGDTWWCTSAAAYFDFKFLRRKKMPETRPDFLIWRRGLYATRSNEILRGGAQATGSIQRRQHSELLQWLASTHDSSLQR